MPPPGTGRAPLAGAAPLAQNGLRMCCVSSPDGEPLTLRDGSEIAIRPIEPAETDPELLATTVPDLDLLDPDLPSVERLETLARDAEAAALAVKGVTKSGGASGSAGIGGLVLVTSHGVRGAQLG